ncbi:MAG: hypothetical protein IJ899_13380 [Blautia sp.]|nr:hypothetical protein [Blautia sp.]
MIDKRKGLPRGIILNFPGISCEVEEEIGRGSNALVYHGSYRDAFDQEQVHHILIKELFPLHPQGKIYRQEDGCIVIEPEAQASFQMHRLSFETGNRAHLALLETCPDQIGANLNTYSLNGTLYTLLGVSGGESLSKIQKAPARILRSCASRMLAILDALEIFHVNGLAHLDIAPDNIILLGEGKRERALLIDYNSTMAVGLNRQKESAVFSVKQGYTAPEVRSGRLKDIGFASDMYSVTAVFYRMIAGTALTNFQMIRALPPDVSECPCVEREPDTVKAWVREILRRGLQTLPARRYQDTASMRRDLEELIDRIDGVGITHWALWEAGRAQVERMVRDNPSLSFIRNSAKLFPAMVTDGKDIYPAEEGIRNGKGSCILLAGGGMGKTTSLLHIVFSQQTRYRPDVPALMYLSLYGYQPGETDYIINSLLNGLHFRSETHTCEDARKALYDLLERPIETAKGEIPVLHLLLDGLNEITGDPRSLLDEIKRLSGMRGVRIVVAGRTNEETLSFPQLHLTELTDQIVRETISGEGMLLPETADMQMALRTPMLLSMYIKSGQMGQSQVRVKSADELLETYLRALKEKAVHDLPEQTDRRWQIDAAVNFVLPAVASDIYKKQCGRNDKDLLPVVDRCYHMLNGRLSRRFFPQWIGRTASIRGGAGNSEEWYGQIIHDILWKQLGLIVRDDQGRYFISHQVIEEYLLNLDRDNRKRILRYHRVRTAIICICLGIAVFSAAVVYRTFLAPPPYEETFAENVMSRALDAYVSAGKQYEMLSDLTECAMESPDLFESQLNLFKNAIPYKGMSVESSLQYLSSMLDTGKVMPWSNKPMDEDACASLMTLSGDREEEYKLFASVLEFVMHDEYANRHYGRKYPQLLASVLETDADIAAELYQIVCTPHLTGKYADQSATAQSFGSLFSSVSGQNEHLTGENVKQARESLTALEGTRQTRLGELYQCGAFAAYGE